MGAANPILSPSAAKLSGNIPYFAQGQGLQVGSGSSAGEIRDDAKKESASMAIMRALRNIMLISYPKLDCHCITEVTT
jgi:hypothetical protein